MISSWDRYRAYAEKATRDGDFELAESMWLQALQEAEQFDARDPRLPLTIEHLADLALKQRKPDLAEELYKKALAIKASTLGPYHLELAASANSLAELYVDHGKFANAEPLFKRVLKIYELSFGQDHVGVAIISTNLAIMCHAQEKYPEAEVLYKRALDIYGRVYGKQHVDTVRVLDNYVDLLLRMGREDEALQIKEQSKGVVSGVWRRTMNRLPHDTLMDFPPVKD